MARLPHRERTLVLQAALVLPAACLTMRMAGLAFTQAWLRRIASRWPAGGEAPDPERLEFLVRAVARPLRASCLARSLVLQFLLLRHGVGVDLRIGVRRGGDGLQAHAWVERDGVLLGDDAADFLPFAGAIRLGDTTPP